MQPSASPTSERKRRVREAFDAIAEQYDTLRFVQVCARRLIELTDLPPGARVLDLATGTGLVALAAQQLVGPAGQVVGVDLSPEMLEKARYKARKLGQPAPVFQLGDGEHLDLPDDSFDAVLCASALFFIPNMQAAVNECRRVLRPGGVFGFTSFGSQFLQPLNQMWKEHLSSYGIEPPGSPNERLADRAECEQLLRAAGFTDVVVMEEDLGYYLSTCADRLSEIAAGLEGLALVHLAPEAREEILQSYCDKLEALTSKDGIWVAVPAIFSFGR